MLTLNFLQIDPQKFTFNVFIKEYDDKVKEDMNLSIHELAGNKISGEKPEYKRYYISFDDLTGFTKVECNEFENRNLTKKVMLKSLYTRLNEISSNVEIQLLDKCFNKRIEVIVEKKKKGNRIITISPYYLKSIKKYGFLIDYRFNLNEGEQNDIEVQKLSLSLDKYGKSNKSYYSDKKRILDWFLQKYIARIGAIANGKLSISLKFEQLTSSKLATKVYYFKDHETSSSQFQGVRNFGAYEEIGSEVKFIFIFEDKYKTFATDLFKSLKGSLYPGVFSGMEKMFGVPFSKNNVDRIAINGYSKEELDIMIEKLVKRKSELSNTKVIGIFIEPNKMMINHFSPYYHLKYHLTKHKIPLQVIDYEGRSKRDALKWSSSGIGLQLFAKLGGIPWIVKPAQNKCLILGIGSAHEFDEDGKIKKYFTYSVCLDSSGVYKKLALLSETNESKSYLENLRVNLISLLKEPQFSSYKKCALHLPFKIKKAEIDAIKEAINQFTEVEFIAIKVNLNNRFFGFSQHNTYVPFESEFIKLSFSEYLVWFEGLQYHSSSISKRIGNPVHLQILNLDENKRDIDKDRAYIQDVLNLSGANWRGFNAKLMPISIYYSQLVARYSKEFEKFEEFDQSIFQYSLPWFL